MLQEEQAGDRSRVRPVPRRALGRPGTSSHPLLGLQRRAGNRATLELLRAGQGKLEVGAAGDRYEQEADAVARQVVDALHRPSPAEPEREGAARALRIARLVQRAGAEVGLDGGPLAPETEQAIESARAGGGRPIEPGLRRRFEGAFGTDLAGVRLHSGPGPAALNEQVQAAAFTVGSDIFLGDRTPDLASRGGHELLAHELTHTIQQTGGAARRVQRAGGGSKGGTGGSSPTTLEGAEKKLQTARDRLAAKKRQVANKKKRTPGDDQSLQALEQNVKQAEERRDEILNAPKTSSWLDFGSWFGGSRIGGSTNDDGTLQDANDPKTGKNTSWWGTNTSEQDWNPQQPETGLVTSEQGEQFRKEDEERKSKELINKILDIPLIEITVTPDEKEESYLGGWLTSKSGSEQQLSLNRQGLKAGGKLEMSLGTGTKVEGGMGPAYVVGEYVNSNTSLETFLGAKGGYEYQLASTWEDLGIEGKAGAFAGSESSLKTEVVWKVGDKEAGRFKGGIGVTFGVGGEIGGTLKWPWGGDLEIKSNLKLAAGLGVAYEIDWKIPTATWAGWIWGGARSMLGSIGSLFGY